MKKYPCTLNQFLLLGQLGFIEVGMSSDDVMEKFGKPQIKNYSWIYQYDSLELHFNANFQSVVEVRLIFSEDPELVLPIPLCAYSYFPDKTTTREELEIYLQLESLTYEVIRYGQGYLTGLRLDSGIFIGFSGFRESDVLHYIRSLRLKLD